MACFLIALARADAGGADATALEPIVVGADGEIHYVEKSAAPGKRAFSLYKDGSPSFHVLEWDTKTEDALVKLKSELHKVFGSRDWDTIRYMNGTVLKTAEELLAVRF